MGSVHVYKKVFFFKKKILPYMGMEAILTHFLGQNLHNFPWYLMFQLFFSIFDLAIKGQGQPQVTISTILVLLKCSRLHTQFQSNRSIGATEDY